MSNNIIDKSTILDENHLDNDEIDLLELWSAIWLGKWIIIAITALFAIASIFYTLSLPNIYQSKTLLAPEQSQKQGGLGGLSGQFGGLASLAGVSLGGGGVDKAGLAIEVIKSGKFFANFAEKYNILPDLMAASDWNLSSNTIIYNEDIYLLNNAEWVREVAPPKKRQPSMQEAKIEFDKVFSVVQSEDTGMITMSIEHYSPYVAKLWLDWLVKDINLVMKVRDKDSAERSIKYLQSQIDKTNIVEQKSLLYELIEEQSKTLMFTEVRDEYVFQTIDPPLVSEITFKPKRALIVILGVLSGGMLSILVVFIRYFARNNSTKQNSATKSHQE